MVSIIQVFIFIFSEATRVSIRSERCIEFYAHENLRTHDSTTVVTPSLCYIHEILKTRSRNSDVLWTGRPRN
jgi:hypothetical protein